MTWDLAMDPITGDFISDGAGGWLRTEYGDTAVLHQLTCHYDRWWAGPTIGSLLFDRDRFGAAPGPLVQAEVERAFGLLVRNGMIADLQVTAAETGAGQVLVRTTYRLVATGQLVDATLPAFSGGS